MNNRYIRIDENVHGLLCYASGVLIDTTGRMYTKAGSRIHIVISLENAEDYFVHVSRIPHQMECKTPVGVDESVLQPMLHIIEIDDIVCDITGDTINLIFTMPDSDAFITSNMQSEHEPLTHNCTGVDLHSPITVEIGVDLNGLDDLYSVRLKSINCEPHLSSDGTRVASVEVMVNDAEEFISRTEPIIIDDNKHFVPVKTITYESDYCPDTLDMVKYTFVMKDQPVKFILYNREFYNTCENDSHDCNIPTDAQKGDSKMEPSTNSTIVGQFNIPENVAKRLSELLTTQSIREKLLLSCVDDQAKYEKVESMLIPIVAEIDAIKNTISREFVPAEFRSDAYMWNYDGYEIDGCVVHILNA